MLHNLSLNVRSYWANNRLFVRSMVIAIVVASLVGGVFAQSVDLDIDTNDFITAINLWLGLAISIVVIGVGIKGAFALARMVGDMIVDAFNFRK